MRKKVVKVKADKIKFKRTATGTKRANIMVQRGGHRL